MRRKTYNVFIWLLTVLCLVTFWLPRHAKAQEKPNILIIWGDGIGYWNISAYHRGMMGYRTPNIDRIANEGAIFTDAYGEQSCTAGRAAFIHIQRNPPMNHLRYAVLGSASRHQKPHALRVADFQRTNRRNP